MLSYILTLLLFPSLSDIEINNSPLGSDMALNIGSASSFRLPEIPSSTIFQPGELKRLISFIPLE